MIDRAFAQRSLDALLRRGFQKARVRLVSSDQHELQAEFGHTNLLRTTHNTRTRSARHRRRQTGQPRSEQRQRRRAGRRGREPVGRRQRLARGPRQRHRAGAAEAGVLQRPRRARSRSDVRARRGGARSRQDVRYPTLKMGSTAISFASRHALFLNSNGVDFDTKRNVYHASMMFTARDGTDVSSFNYTGMTLGDARPAARVARHHRYTDASDDRAGAHAQGAAQVHRRSDHHAGLDRRLSRLSRSATSATSR